MSTDSSARRSPSLRGFAKALAYGLPGVLLATSSIAASLTTLEEKTLARFHDPVIVSGGSFVGVPDRRTARLRLYRVRDDVLEAIPYQFDQLDASGQIVTPPPAVISTITTGLVTPLNEPEFMLDDNDELVFMAKDTGSRAVLDPMQLGSDWSVEIEVRDPRSTARGWVYLLHFPEELGSDSLPPPRSSLRYTYFDVGLNRVISTYYELQYAKGYSFFNGMQIAPAAGGSDRDIVNSMRIRVRPTFSFWIARWSPKISEDDFHVDVEGIRSGPVRAVRRVRQSLRLGGLLPVTPKSKLSTYYYFSSFISPSTVSIPGLALRMLSDFEFVGVTEFAPGVKLRYWDGANPDGIELGSGDTKNAAGDAAILDIDHDWWAIRSPGGSCVHAFLLPEEWKQWGIVRGTALSDPYANDDDRQADPPGPVLGYSLLNMTKLQHGGTWEVQMATLILQRSYEPGDEVQALDMLLEPLETHVHVMSTQKSAFEPPPHPPI